MKVGGERHAPAALLLGERHGTQFTEGWVAPGLVWMGAENLSQPGFDPWTLQPVVSRYTD